jgi:hypothetical protein
MDGSRFKLDFWRECYAQFNSGDTSMLCFINSKLVSKHIEFIKKNKWDIYNKEREYKLQILAISHKN